jgi:hypothetical protein
MTAPKNPKPWLLGPLSPSKPGRHHIEPKRDFGSPQRHCNSLMPAMTPTDTSRLAMLSRPARPGADQHAQYRSYGTLC